MTLLLRIAAVVVLMFGPSLLIDRFDLSHRLSPRLAVLLGNRGIELAMLIPALFIFCPPLPSHQRQLVWRIGLSVLVSWYLINEFHNLMLPTLQQLALERSKPGELPDDNINLGVGMLWIFGWIPPLLVALASAGLLHVCQGMCKSKVQSQTDGDPDPNTEEDEP